MPSLLMAIFILRIKMFVVDFVSIYSKNDKPTVKYARAKNKDRCQESIFELNW